MPQDNKESISKAPSGRKKRSPVTGRDILTVEGKDPNYIYRIVNDKDSRVARMESRDYEVVVDESVTVGDSRTSGASQVGSAKSFPVGGGVTGVLMRIRRDWYEEDQKEKAKLVDEQEATMKQKALDGTYGTISVGGKEDVGSLGRRVK